MSREKEAMVGQRVSFQSRGFGLFLWKISTIIRELQRVNVHRVIPEC